MVSAPSGPPAALTAGGTNIGPAAYNLKFLIACSRISGVKSIRSSTVTCWRAYAAGLVGNGCVGEYHSPGTDPFGTGRSSIGHTGWPVTRSNTYRNASLLGTATALIARPLTVMSARIGGDERS